MLDFRENVTGCGLTVFREYEVGGKFFEVKICKFESKIKEEIFKRIMVGLF